MEKPTNKQKWTGPINKGVIFHYIKVGINMINGLIPDFPISLIERDLGCLPVYFVCCLHHFNVTPDLICQVRNFNLPEISFLNIIKVQKFAMNGGVLFKNNFWVFVHFSSKLGITSPPICVLFGRFIIFLR